jgi:hypothetical protein
VDAAIQQSYEQLGRAQAGQAAQLLGEELSARRQELLSLLNQGAGILTADEARDLTRSLGEINAEIERLGQEYRRGLGEADIDLRRQLGLSDIDLRRQLGLSDIDLRRQLGLGQLQLGWAGLGQQRQNFLDQLAYNQAVQEQLLQQQLLQLLYGG